MHALAALQHRPALSCKEQLKFAVSLRHSVYHGCSAHSNEVLGAHAYPTAIGLAKPAHIGAVTCKIPTSVQHRTGRDGRSTCCKEACHQLCALHSFATRAMQAWLLAARRTFNMCADALSFMLQLRPGRAYSGQQLVKQQFCVNQAVLDLFTACLPLPQLLPLLAACCCCVEPGSDKPPGGHAAVPDGRHVPA